MTLALLAVATYVALGIAASILVVRARRRDLGTPRETPFVSVIVAARNEEDALSDCLAALAAQNYPQESIEFIVVDDESTDGTRALVEAKAASDPRFRVMDTQPLPGHPPGKSAALHTGIEAAEGDILLFTDADCRPPAQWVEALASELSHPDVGAVGGTTRVIGRDLHARMQANDWTLLKGVAAGWSLAGFPLTAMGNNMGIRREAYDDVGGYPELQPSVTEDYALFRAIGKAGWEVRLDPHPALENRTLAERRVRDVFRQRRRWARGSLAASPLAVAFYAVVYAAHLLPLLILATHPSAAGVMIAAKALTDALVLTTASARGSAIPNLIAWPLYELYLYAYLLLLPVSLAVVPDITWKSRPFRQGDSGGTGL